MVIGVSLSRTITQAVHGLYEGTTSIAKGEFSHRIPVSGKDQLAELGQSFNGMTAQLQSLVEVAKEKERMRIGTGDCLRSAESVVSPRSAPAMNTIELVGVCHGRPHGFRRLLRLSASARWESRVAFGDVAGKGISAALLMASIQSIDPDAACSWRASAASPLRSLSRN